MTLGAVSLGQAQAQTTTTEEASTTSASSTDIDYDSWNIVAERAEDVLIADRASSLALEQLRSQIADWRSQFLKAQSTNSDRIAILESQISALGAVPEEGATESEEIASRRQVLNAQLETLLVPVRRAEEAYTQADGLVSQIDKFVRERQTDALLDLGASPLIPGNWTDPVKALVGVFVSAAKEVQQAWNTPAQRAEFRSALLRVIVLLLIGLVLILRGRPWSVAIANRILDRMAQKTQAIALSMLVSVGQMVLPVIGIFALREAAYATSLFGLSGGAILAALMPMGISFFAARWLGGQVFPKLDGVPTPMDLDLSARLRGRVFANTLGIILAVWGLLYSLVSARQIEEDAQFILAFPLLVLIGFCLFNIGRLMVRSGRHHPDEMSPEVKLRDRVMDIMGRAAMLFGVVGPLLGAIGYSRAAELFTISPALSLGLFAFVSIIQRLISQIYALIFGRREDGDDGLIPVLISFGILLLSLPVLALIWQARVSDLTEMWSKFLTGFQMGDTQVSPADFLLFVVVFVIGYAVTRLVQGALRSSILPKTNIDKGGQTAIISGTGYLGIFLAAVIAISSAGLDLSNLAIVAGALSVGIGFGLQTIVQNFVSGIILLIERPITEGDWIEVGGIHGTVRRISVRATRIETFDRSDVILPNADLVSGTVTNYTHGNMAGRIIVPVGVAYGTDTRRVAKILQEIAEENPLVILRPPPAVIMTGFGADSLDFEIRAILRDVNFSITAKSEMFHAIADRFTKEGIEIPFAQRDLWLRNPEALRQGAEPTQLDAPAQDVPVQEADPKEEQIT
ncbi:mechanosensitive ion channel family protein [Alphaproteobacteria bacterium KMM 3653]|uniref:Mechanosensitive ion channel family protein n=1 Tax=Harenicola maris TaxID=2841044 RepID=A0AAP2G785_9RHOB|nr:mechanosensitive ion channel family protein [Harenicola maris]